LKYTLIIMEYIVDFDSSERNPELYPNTNDFVVNLNTPLYNVTNMDLVSARFPLSQLLINDGNKYIDIDDTKYDLLNGSFSNGTDLASNLQARLSTTNFTVDSVVFHSNTNSMTYSNTAGTDNFTFNFFGGEDGFATTSNIGTPANILGFNNSNISSSGFSLTSNVVDIGGPSNIIIRLTNGSEDLQKTLYVDNSNLTPLTTHFMGRISTSDVPLNGILDYNGYDDPVTHYFHRGPETSIDQLRIRIYWNNGNKLIPYDFGASNIFLKFKVKCSLDKIYNIKDDKPPPDDPPPVKIQSLNPIDRLDHKKKLMFIAAIVLLVLGLILISMLGSRPQPRAE